MMKFVGFWAEIRVPGMHLMMKLAAFGLRIVCLACTANLPTHSEIKPPAQELIYFNQWEVLIHVFGLLPIHP